MYSNKDVFIFWDIIMTTSSILQTLNSSKVKKILYDYGINHLWIHGSMVHGTSKDDSDIDLLYERNENKERKDWWPISAIMFLEELIGKTVDMGSIHHIAWPFEKSILSSAKQLR